VPAIKETIDPYNIVVDISPGKALNISANLDSNQQEQLVNILQNHLDAFSWDYKDMSIIHPDTCTHHIYVQENSKPIRHPQCRMNPSMKDIVK
jgi:hypothetical protein